MNNADTPTTPVPIQTAVGISIAFNMGLIPVDNLGCYVKYSFPDDFKLTSAVMTYQGYDMMTTSTGNSNLALNQDVFIKNQARENGNYIIFKGCQDSNSIGEGRVPKIKITGPVTPSAAKQTGDFKVEVYKKYEETINTLSNMILSGTGFIAQERFTSGSISGGLFSGLIKFI